MRTRIAILLGSLFLLCATAALPAAEVAVFAAASLTDCLTEIGKDYQKSGGAEVSFNFGASSLLARQIEEGAPADIFFSADEAKMNDLERRGLIETNTRVSRLGNSLVIVVPGDGGATIAKAADLANPQIKRVALADPGAVPAGVYAKAWLQRIGLWAAVEPKVIPALNVRAALAAVESGNVDAGIVFKTDAAVSRKVKVACAPPPGQTPDISYPMAMLKSAGDPDKARKFLAYLNSGAAGRVFEKFGFALRAPRR